MVDVVLGFELIEEGFGLFVLEFVGVFDGLVV